MFKAYTRKSSAITGAERAGLEAAAVVQHEGQWGFFVAEGKGAPKLSGGGGSSGGTSSALVAVEAAKTVGESLANATAQMMGKMNDTLGDIKKLIFDENMREEENDRAARLRQLETDRERQERQNSSKPGMFSKIAEKTGGLMNVLKALAIPALIGFLVGLDKKFKLLAKVKDKVVRWVVNIQNFLDGIADLPMFKGNIVGKGIKALIPIGAAFGAFALLKPAMAVKMLKGIGKFAEILTGPSIAKMSETIFKLPEGMGKFGKFLGFAGKIFGKVFLPLTIITTVWETIQGAIDGYKKDGIVGALKGGLDGLIHGLIGGLVETISTGIGWIIDQFGGDGAAFKEFKFGDFIQKISDNFFIFWTTILDDMKAIFSSDQGFFGKLMDVVMYPFKMIGDQFKKVFGGLSPMEAIKKVINWVSGNDSAPAPAINFINPANKQSMTASPPGRRSIAQAVTGSNSANLEAEARKNGMTDAQIAYAYETDRMIGAPRGATLAQIKQESAFSNTARSKTGAVGLTQFTSIAVKDVLATQRGVDPKKISDAEVAAAKGSLSGNSDKALEFHRQLMRTIQRRNKGDWSATMRDYNGDVKLENNGMQARDNYIAKISGYLGTQGMTAVPRNSAAALTSRTEEAAAGKKQGGAVNVAPVNASRTNVNNQTHNHLPNLSASTPVEFAPHVA